MNKSQKSFEQSAGIVIFGNETTHESSGSLGVSLDGLKFKERYSLEFFFNFLEISF